MQVKPLNFTSHNIDYKERMYQAFDNRMIDSDGFGLPMTRFHCIEGYNEALNKFNVKDFVRLGGESAVFELQNNNILKMSAEKYTPFLSEYHAPEIDRGEINLSREYRARNNTLNQYFDTNKIYYVVQEKGNPVRNSSEALPLFQKAEKEGLYAYDFAPDQFAFFETNKGKQVRCIDLGCIADSKYPLARDLEVIEKMPARNSCTPYGITYSTVKKYFFDVLKNSDEIMNMVNTISAKLQNGENIFSIMNNFLSKFGKPVVGHIK